MKLDKAAVAAKIAKYYQTQLTQGPVDVVVSAFEERPEGGHLAKAEVAFKTDVESGNADKIALTIGCSDEGVLDWSSAVIDATGDEKPAPSLAAASVDPEAFKDRKPPENDEVPTPMPADAAKPEKEMPKPDSGVEFVTDEKTGGEATPADKDHPAAALAMESKKQKRREARARVKPADELGWPTGDALLVDEKTMPRVRINEDGTAVDGEGQTAEEDGFSIDELLADEEASGEIDFESLPESQQTQLAAAAMAGAAASAGVEAPASIVHPLEESMAPAAQVTEDDDDDDDKYDMDGELNAGEPKPAEETAATGAVDTFINNLAADFADQNEETMLKSVEAFCSSLGIDCTEDILSRARAAIGGGASDAEDVVAAETSIVTIDPVIGLANLVGGVDDELAEPDEETDEEEDLIFDEIEDEDVEDDMEAAAEEGCPAPGSKIKSKGQGRGLARGRGKGPIGVPKNEAIIGRGRGLARGRGRGPLGRPALNISDEDVEDNKAAATAAGCPAPGSKIRSKGKGRGLARGRGKGPVGVPVKEDKSSGSSEEETAHVEESVMRNSMVVRLGETASVRGIAEAIHERFPELKYVILEAEDGEGRQLLFNVDPEWDLDATVNQVNEALQAKVLLADATAGPELTEDEVASYSFGLAGGSQGIGMDKEGYQGQKNPTTQKDPNYGEKNTSPGPKNLSGTPEGEQGGAQAAGTQPTKGDKKKQQKVGPSTNDSGTDGSPGPKKLAKVKKDEYGGSGNKSGAKKAKESFEDAMTTFLTETVVTHLKEQNPFAVEAEEEEEADSVDADVAAEMGAEEADYGAEFAEAPDLDPVIISMVQAQADHSLEAAHEVAEAYFSEQGMEYSDDMRSKVEEIFKSFSEPAVAAEEEEAEEEVVVDEPEAEGGEAVEVETEARGMEYESIARKVLGDELYEKMISAKKRLKQETMEAVADDEKLTQRIRERVEKVLNEESGAGSVITQKDHSGHPDSWQRVQMKAGTRTKTGKIKPNVKFKGKVRVVWDDGHEEFIEPSKLNNVAGKKKAGGEQAKVGGDKAPQMSTKEWGGKKGLESIQRESEQRRRLDTAVEHLVHGGKFPESELIEVLIERADEFKAPLKGLEEDAEETEEEETKLEESKKDEKAPVTEDEDGEEEGELSEEELEEMAEALLDDEEFTIISEDMDGGEEEFSVTLTEDEMSEVEDE